ncbi:MAG: histidine--tRNA ligase [Rickettsiales bacterium]|jgi:histidyl-tRNA synthetase|nr:histidine--tRNA ligase [Rickettsiales bacterium]
MSSKLQPVRGTHDILPQDFSRFHLVTEMARELARLYGFKEMATPIFEATEVFSRSMGESSDVVSKEMFTFTTKGEESVTLRPEFTAGIMRAYISNGMQQYLPLKLFSTGPLFRYERPQKGRQRQFHQVNFEWLGDASPEVDAELITLAGHLLYYLSGKSCKLLINTLGDAESRARYRTALLEFLNPIAAQLSEDSQRRLSTNPLRILDSKSPQDQELLTNAPNLHDFLSQESRQRFEHVYAMLKHSKAFHQEIEIAPSLVRGLDYYSHTVFEFVDNSGGLGAQNTVLAGGRYDGLVEQMGGKPTPGIGFAAGVERLMLIAEKLDIFRHLPDVKIIIIPFEEIESEFILLGATSLRLSLASIREENHLKQHFSAEILWHGSVKKRLEKAAQLEATHVILMPPDEAKQGKCLLKNMKTGVQIEIALDDFTNKTILRERLGIPTSHSATQ